VPSIKSRKNHNNPQTQTVCVRHKALRGGCFYPPGRRARSAAPLGSPALGCLASPRLLASCFGAPLGLACRFEPPWRPRFKNRGWEVGLRCCCVNCNSQGGYKRIDCCMLQLSTIAYDMNCTNTNEQHVHGLGQSRVAFHRLLGGIEGWLVVTGGLWRVHRAQHSKCIDAYCPLHR
jgi:hypothetical protein